MHAIHFTWYIVSAIYDPLIDACINLPLNTLKSCVNSLVDSSWNPCIQGLANNVFNERSKAFNIIQLTVA